MDGEQSVRMLREGYLWGPRVRGSADAAAIRIAGRRAAVVGGPEGVRRFYDPRLQRRGAFPPPVKLVLFGPGTVHGLDDEEHHARKALHLGVLTGARVAELASLAEREWAERIARWPARDRVVLFDEAVQVLGRSVMRWGGVPEDEDLGRRAEQMATVVHGFGKPGPAYARAVVARLQLGHWTKDLVRRVRDGRASPAAGTALHAAATATDRAGRLLPERVAATELLNVLRPTVAVAWFVSFAGRALDEDPGWRQRIADGDRPALVAFCQELRRHSPFTPFLAALTRRPQDVLGISLPRWSLVVLDVYGTLHDPAHWDSPDEFRPERFLDRDVDPDLLVPQGGGDVGDGHRCPGEDVVLTLLAVAVRALARTPLQLPPQDLAHDLNEMPTRPRSGVSLAARGGAR